MSNFRFPYQSENPITTLSRPEFLDELNNTTKWRVATTGTNWNGSNQQFQLDSTGGPNKKIEIVITIGPDNSGVFSVFYRHSVLTNQLQRDWTSFNFCYWKENTIRGGHFYFYMTYNSAINLPICYCNANVQGGNVDYYKIYYRYVD